MENLLYTLLGICSIILGIYVTINRIKMFIKGQQTNSPFNFKMTVAGLGAIALGIALIANHI